MTSWYDHTHNKMAQLIGRVIRTNHGNVPTTIKVSVIRSSLHPVALRVKHFKNKLLNVLNLQYVTKRKCILVHDENEECHLGDLVMIREMDKVNNTAFRVLEIVQRSESYTSPYTGKTYYQPLK